MCPTYTTWAKKNANPQTTRLYQNLEAVIAPALTARLQLAFNLTICDVDNLWTACMYEAGTLLVRACMYGAATFLVCVRCGAEVHGEV